ncbi:MAG: periplasmic glucans biosynthesis protein [Caulobacter sp.]|nr:periplasmic glucans biosynthesis protein [Caulobacter sp.]
MDRRLLLAGLAITPLLAGPATAGPFRRKRADFFDAVRREAAALARKPYAAPPKDLEPELAALGYDAYRDIVYRPEKALWADLDLPFQAQFFHRGGPAPQRVAVHELVEGRVVPIAYSPELFKFGPQGTIAPTADIGFSGFRLHTALNTPGVMDELIVFQGASYFRSLGRGQRYGLSARALALNTGEQGPEEFPDFRTFWIQRPAPGDLSVTVYALTDSPSCAAAHQFIITPGDATVIMVACEVAPRAAITTLGIAPMSSMYDFGDDGAERRDDFRPAAHDSDGLAMLTGRGRALWRPLSRPSRVRTSVFTDRTPKGFGLQQRNRDFDSYQDLETRYDLRPDCWVEPLGDWGDGAVRLLELPAKGEWEDNIAAFWRPAGVLRPGHAKAWRYRLTWGRWPAPQGLAAVLLTRSGAADTKDARRYVIDFAALPADAAATPKVTASSGVVDAVTLEANPQTGGARLAFRVTPGDVQVVELQAVLEARGRPVSETWVDQWTPA